MQQQNIVDPRIFRGRDSELDRLPRIGGMATMPPRAHSFSRVLMDILAQVDHLFVFLDKHDTVPPAVADRHNVTPLLPAQFGELGGAGKLLGAELYASPCLYFCFDDDIFYPANYVEVMTRALMRYHGGAVVGVHGAFFCPPHLSYRDNRLIIHFAGALNCDVAVDALGSGTIAFCTEQFRPNPRDWSYTDMLDLMIAIDAAVQGLAKILIRRPANFLRPIEDPQSDSVFCRLLTDDARQTRIMRAALEAHPQAWQRWGLTSAAGFLADEPDIRVSPRTGRGRSPPEARNEGGLILLYHDVYRDGPMHIPPSASNVKPEILAEQLRWLKGVYEIVDLDTLLATADRRGMAAVTFDNGYACAIGEALPLLRELGISATFFLNGALLEGKPYWLDQVRFLMLTGVADPFIESLPANAPERRFLSAPHLLETSKLPDINSLRLMRWLDEFFAAAGLRYEGDRFTTAATLPDDQHLIFGSHSYSHPNLISLSDDEARFEIRRNREILERLPLSRARISKVFGMPFGTIGTYSERTLQILAEEGHQYVVLTTPIDRRLARNPPIEWASRFEPPASLAALQLALLP